MNALHAPKPLDAYADAWLCSCGTVFEVESGFVICPDDPREGNALR